MANGYNISSTHISLSLDVTGLSSSYQWVPTIYMKVGSQPTTSSYDAKYGPRAEDFKYGGDSSVVTFTGANSNSALRYARSANSIFSSSSVPPNAKIYFIVEFQAGWYDSTNNTINLQPVSSETKAGPLFQGYYFITPMYFPQTFQIEKKGWENNQLKVEITFTRSLGRGFLGAPHLNIEAYENDHKKSAIEIYPNWNSTSGTETFTEYFTEALTKNVNYVLKIGWERDQSSYHQDFPVLWSNDQSYYLFKNFSTEEELLSYWRWNAANGPSGMSTSATAIETQTAYTAMGGTDSSKIFQQPTLWEGTKGAFSNFSYKVWNDILSFVDTKLNDLGLYWSGTYPSVSESGTVLTAAMYTQFLININRVLSELGTAAASSTYTARYSASKQYPDSGDVVYAVNFLRPLQYLNYAIADYNGDQINNE